MPISRIEVDPKHPSDIDWRYIVWCDEDGTNTGGATDTGDLQGATISTSTWTVTGLTNVTSNTSAVTIEGVSYGANTVAAIKLSGGTAGTVYELLNSITTSDSRTLHKIMRVPVETYT